MEKVEADDKEVAFLRSKYPHAFCKICKESLGRAISVIRMPGEKKSNYQLEKERKEKERKEREKREEVRKKGMQNISFPSVYIPPIESLPGIDWDLLNPVFQPRKAIGNSFPKREFSIAEVQKILARKAEFKSIEDKILAILKKEDTEIDYEDKVLANPKRAEYVAEYLKSVGRTPPEKWRGYVLMNLDELDRFIEHHIDKEYRNIQTKFPKGLRHFEEVVTRDKSIIVKSQAQIHQYNKLVKEYEELKKIFPKGVVLFEKTVSTDKSVVVQSKDKIKLMQKNAVKYDQYCRWETLQETFTKRSAELHQPNYGWYCYDIDFQCITPDGQHRSGKYTVWQHFPEAFYSGKKNSTIPYIEDLKTNAEQHPDFINRTRHFYDWVYDNIFELILRFKSEWKTITILWGDSSVQNYKLFNDFHFKYLRKKLDAESIPHLEIKDFNPTNSESHIVVIELITTNDHLKRNCSEIIRKSAQVMESSCEEGSGPKWLKLLKRITYVSLRKEYDEREVADIVQNKIQEIEAKERQQREEQERMDREKRAAEELRERELRLLQQRKALVSSLRNNSKMKELGFEPRTSTLQCFALYNYYPTTCEFEATEKEWEIRRLIWDFKASYGEIAKHKRTVQELLPKVKRCLEHFYGNNLSKLTFVCIPASSKSITELRYKDFSASLCSITGMGNGNDYVRIIKDGKAKHSGGTESMSYKVDEIFFRGKLVILFDDVITRGGSMERMRKLLVAAGADVIAGFSIGRTRHERQGCNPYDLV